MTAGKIRDRADAVRWRQSLPGRVVFTNGVFDLLHAGHVTLLERSRARGDALVVGVNSDRSARALGKGPGRPFQEARDRARIVAALAAVDCVVLFDDDTPEPLVASLEPDVLVKGADYRPDAIPGASHVRARGGEVAVLPLLEGHSTTRIVERIHAAS